MNSDNDSGPELFGEAPTVLEQYDEPVQFAPEPLRIQAALNRERKEVLDFIASEGPGGRVERRLIQEHLHKSKTIINKHLRFLRRNRQITRLPAKNKREGGVYRILPPRGDGTRRAPGGWG